MINSINHIIKYMSFSVKSTKNAIELDSIQAFTFDDYPIRGWIIRLNDSYRRIILKNHYPDLLQRLMAESLVSSLVVAKMCTKPGVLDLSYESTQGVTLIKAKSTKRNEIRGLIQSDGPIPNKKALTSALKHGTLEINYQADASDDTFQNVIPLHSPSITEAICDFLEQAQQLPTLFRVVVTPHAVVSICLQYEANELSNISRLGYDHALIHLNKTKETVFLQHNNRNLLTKIYANDDITLEQRQPVVFKCHCSRYRIQNAIMSMGEEQLEDILSGNESIEVTCEYCHKIYDFDRIDVLQLFKIGRNGGLSDALH